QLNLTVARAQGEQRSRFLGVETEYPRKIAAVSTARVVVHHELLQTVTGHVRQRRHCRDTAVVAEIDARARGFENHGDAIAVPCGRRRRRSTTDPALHDKPGGVPLIERDVVAVRRFLRWALVSRRRG